MVHGHGVPSGAGVAAGGEGWEPHGRAPSRTHHRRRGRLTPRPPVAPSLGERFSQPTRNDHSNQNWDFGRCDVKVEPFPQPFTCLEFHPWLTSGVIGLGATPGGSQNFQVASMV